MRTGPQSTDKNFVIERAVSACSRPMPCRKLVAIAIMLYAKGWVTYHAIAVMVHNARQTKAAKTGFI